MVPLKKGKQKERVEELEEWVSWKTSTEIIQTSPSALAEKSWESRQPLALNIPVEMSTFQKGDRY